MGGVDVLDRVTPRGRTLRWSSIESGSIAFMLTIKNALVFFQKRRMKASVVMVLL